MGATTDEVRTTSEDDAVSDLGHEARSKSDPCPVIANLESEIMGLGLAGEDSGGLSKANTMRLLTAVGEIRRAVYGKLMRLERLLGEQSVSCNLVRVQRFPLRPIVRSRLRRQWAVGTLCVPPVHGLLVRNTMPWPRPPRRRVAVTVSGRLLHAANWGSACLRESVHQVHLSLPPRRLSKNPWRSRGFRST